MELGLNVLLDFQRMPGDGALVFLPVEDTIRAMLVPVWQRSLLGEAKVLLMLVPQAYNLDPLWPKTFNIEQVDTIRGPFLGQIVVQLYLTDGRHLSLPQVIKRCEGSKGGWVRWQRCSGNHRG